MVRNMAATSLHTPATQVALDFSIPADVDALEPVLNVITDFAVRKLGPESGKHLAVALASQEALTNAVKHGCQGDRSKTVHCKVAFDPSQGVQVVVSDPGAGFNPDALPVPITRKGMKKGAARGVFMIRFLMDEVYFARNGAEIHMVKH